MYVCVCANRNKYIGYQHNIAQPSPFGTSNLVMRALVLTVWAYRNHLWKENSVSLAVPVSHVSGFHNLVIACGHCARTQGLTSSWLTNAKQDRTCDKLWPTDHPSKKMQKAFFVCKPFSPLTLDSCVSLSGYGMQNNSQPVSPHVMGPWVVVPPYWLHSVVLCLLSCRRACFFGMFNGGIKEVKRYGRMGTY